MTQSPQRVVLPMLWLLAIISQLFLFPAAQEKERKVTVDNSLGNNAVEGSVTDPNPNRSRIIIKNLNNYWTNIVIQPPIGTIHLIPANPLDNIKDIGGIYATLKVLAPYQEAVWYAEFDPKLDATQMILTTPTIRGSNGSTFALALNELSILANIAGKAVVVKSADKFIKAVEIAMSIEDFAGLIQALEDEDFFSFSEHFYNLLSDSNKRVYLAEAFTQLEVPLSAETLGDLVEFIGFYQAATKVWDIIRSILRGNETGTITFSVPRVVLNSPTKTDSSLTYTSSGELFEVSTVDGNITRKGAAPPKGIVKGLQNNLFWIDGKGADGPCSSDKSFNLIQSDFDGGNQSVLLTCDAFQAKFPDYIWLPNALSASKDGRHLYFANSKYDVFNEGCSVFALDIATKDVRELYQCGGGVYAISPDGTHAIGSARREYPGISYLISTILFPTNQPEAGVLNYASPLRSVWLSDGRFIYSVEKGRSRDDPPTEVNENGQRIILASEDGSTIRILAANTFATQLAISPDEQNLAYIVSDETTFQEKELWIVNINEGSKRKVADVPEDARDLNWRSFDINVANLPAITPIIDDSQIRKVATLVTSIQFDHNLGSIAVNSNTHQAYVASGTINKLHKIDGTNYNIKTYRPDWTSGYIAVNSLSNIVYLSVGNKYYSVLDGDDLHPIRRVTYFGGGRDLSVDTQQGTIYTSGEVISDSVTFPAWGRIYESDYSTDIGYIFNTPNTFITSMATNPDTQHLYVATRPRTAASPSNFYIFGGTTLITEKQSESGYIESIAVNTQKGKVYISSSDGRIIVYNDNNLAVIAQYNNHPYKEIAINESNGHLYAIKRPNQLHILDGDTLDAISIVTIGSEDSTNLTQIAVDPKTSQIWLVDIKSSQVHIVQDIH